MLAIQRETERTLESDMIDRPRIPALSDSFQLVTAGGHTDGVRDELRALLTNLNRTPGVEIREDPGRKGFFDIEHAGRTYFVYVYPSLARVLLIATWAPGCYHHRVR